jgi:PAS domain S-box-containing protein
VELAVRPLRVLLVEDDGFDADLTIERLKSVRPDCVCTVVDHEAAFVAALDSGEFDLVLSDFALPSFSGLEALSLARRLRPELPFIFVSGVLGEEHVVDMLKLGATDYVVKGRMERLPLVVERALAEVAERKRRLEFERALRESETLYSRLVESLQDHAVILLSLDGAIRSWNGAAHTAFGWTHDEVRGRNAALLFGADASAQQLLAEHLARARADGQSSEDRWMRRKDGGAFYSANVFTALRDADGSVGGFAMIARDDTAKRQADEAVRAAKNEAEHANQAKNRFLAVLSHELRTPLTPLLAVAHIMQNVPDLPPRVAQLVPMIKRNVELEARLIDDLLDLTSIERGKLTLHTAPLDLHATLRDALEMSAGEIERKRLQLELRLDAARSVTVADDARLQQVFSNLIRNAVKFTPEGGRILIETANQGEDGFTLAVTDSGIGIAPEALPSIFELFEQGETQINPAYGGLGIGLAIERAMTQHHGGSLTATSDGRGRGARFVVRLPLEPAELAPPPERHVDGVDGFGHDTPREVLVVEDHADVAEAVRAMLETTGCRVQIASSLGEARKALASQRFDLLVCDLGLPDGSGHEVLAISGAQVPAIAMSGYGMEADIRRSAAAGFAAHIVKPFEPQQLYAAMAALATAPEDGERAS